MRHSLIASVYVVLEDDGRILMLRRFNTGFADGKYSLVAGHVEKGESFTEAAVREAKEEAGISIKKEDLEFFHLMHRITSSDERVDVFFRVKKWSGDVINGESDRCDELVWVNPEDLPEDTLDYVAHAIQCSAKRAYSSEWKEVV